MPWRRVLSLQEILSGKGYALNCDGDFGSKTRAALMAYQADSLIPQTGFADAATLILLGMLYGTATISANTQDVFSGPGAYYPIIGQLTGGEPFHEIETTGWTLILFEGEIG